MVSALDRKLLRDLVHLRGQVVTIALVVACGIAAFVALRSTYRSLREARASYYERERMPDVVAHLERAPESILSRVLELDGVAMASSRVVADVKLPLSGLVEPPTGKLISIPDDDLPALAGVIVRDGVLPDPTRSDEALVLESFANAHAITLGMQLPVVVKGTMRTVRVVGTAMTPEYVIPVSGLDPAPDPKRFVVLFMRRSAVAPSLDLDGSFNDVVVRVQPGASRAAVARSIEHVLEPYGCLGATPRDKLVSEVFLEGELSQLRGLATYVPAIFLGVAAFLLHVVLSRLVHLQRSQIATLKAVGYSDLSIGLHYVKLVSVVVVLGSLLGVAIGGLLGGSLTSLYEDYFFFPARVYRLDPSIATVAVGVSLVAALVGALSTVRGIMKLPPAEAMQPPRPLIYRRSVFDRIGVATLFGVSGSMVLREIRRNPSRTVLSSLGIAAAVGIVVAGRFGYDSFEQLIDVQFQRAFREDVSAAYLGAVPARVESEIAHLPGVRRVESMRVVPVRFAAGHRFRDSVIMGYPEPQVLRRVLDMDGTVFALPEEGLVLTRKLAEILGVGAGDTLRVEVREGDRKTHDVRVAGLVDEPMGLQGHMRLDALGRLLHEPDLVSLSLLRIDPGAIPDVERRLRDLPKVGAITRKNALVERFRHQSGRQMATITLVLSIFAAVIAIGVVYNNARVALSSRSRDLASLRVLGFTRGEISAILLGELSIQVALGIPIGLVFGRIWAELIARSVDPETYRLPLHIASSTYAFAATLALGAALVSALLVRRRLDELDLVGVLKTRE